MADGGGGVMLSREESCEPLECHLDMADISDDWVSLLMLDSCTGSDSVPLSRDFSFSNISSLEADFQEGRGKEHAGCDGDTNNVDQGLFPTGALWCGIESRDTSSTSSLFASTDGSESDLMLHPSSGRSCSTMEAGFPGVPHVSLQNSPSTSARFSHMCSFGAGELSSWPSSASSFMEMDASDLFLAPAGGGVEPFADQDLGFRGSHMSSSSAEMSDDSKSSTDIARSSPAASSAASPASSMTLASGDSSSGSHCKGSDVIRGDMALLDEELVADGSETESPTSSPSPSVSVKADCTHVTRSLEDECQHKDDLLSKTQGDAQVTGETGATSSASSTEGTNDKDVPHTKGGSFDMKDFSDLHFSRERSPMVQSGWQNLLKLESNCSGDSAQRSKDAKSHGFDGLLVQEAGSASSEGHHSDVSDGDKKEFNGVGDEEDEKRRARLMRNRESAQQSRQRKKLYVDELEQKLRTMAATVAELNATISHLTAENVSLRRQLGYLYPPTPALVGRPAMMPPPLFPVAPYPGMYGMRPLMPGVPAPLVPIPRLKTQVSMSKSAKTGKSSSANKDEGGDKKRRRKAAGAASVGVLGLFCFLVLVGPLSWSVPRTDNNNQNGSRLDRSHMSRVGMRVLNSWEEERNPQRAWIPSVSRWLRFGGWAGWAEHGQVHLESYEPLNRRESSLSKPVRGLLDDNLSMRTVDCEGMIKNVSRILELRCSKELQSQRLTGGDTSDEEGSESGINSQAKHLHYNSRNTESPVVFVGEMLSANASQPFAVSLSVPREDKLVRIDGSLIIQAIMAGDQAAVRNVELRSKGEGMVSKVDKALLHRQVQEKDDEERQSLQGVGEPVLHQVSTNAHGEGEQRPNDKALVRAHGGEAKALPANQGAGRGINLFPTIEAGENFSQLILDDLTGLGFSTGICTEVFRFDATPAEVQISKQEAARPVKGRRAAQNVTNQRHEGRLRRSRRDPSAIPLPPAQTQASNDTIPADDALKRQKHESSMVVSVFTALQNTEDEAQSMKGNVNLFVVVLVDGVKYVTYSCGLSPSQLQPQVVSG